MPDRKLTPIGPAEGEALRRQPRGTTLSTRIQPTRLGEMLRLYRTVRQWSLRDIAQETGIGHATLMRIEHGQAFDAATLLRLWSWLIEPLPNGS